MSKLIDLHVHSTFSDGAMTPTQLVAYAKKKGLSAIAITDHDTIDGIDEAMSAGNKEGIEIIPGVELSVETHTDEEVHILGLCIDYKSKDLAHKFKILVEGRKERNIKMVKRLNELGFDITYDEIVNTAKEEIVARPHFAKVLTVKGYVANIAEAFEKYLGAGKPAYIKRKLLSPKDAIELITCAGGISIFAHPGLLHKSPQQTEEIIVEYKRMGIEGIEVYHSDHNTQTTKLLQHIAKKHNLLISGGSDFHGDNKYNIDIGTGYGNLAIDYDILNKIKIYKGKKL